MPMECFDVILSIDWLSRYQAMIDYVHDDGLASILKMVRLCTRPVSMPLDRGLFYGHFFEREDDLKHMVVCSSVR